MKGKYLECVRVGTEKNEDAKRARSKLLRALCRVFNTRL